MRYLLLLLQELSIIFEAFLGANILSPLLIVVFIGNIPPLIALRVNCRKS